MADTSTTDLASSGSPSPSDLLMTVDVSDTSMSPDGTNKKALISDVLDLAFPINLAADVTGDLPLSNLAQGSALSVLGVTGNATADNASIAAGSDKQVLRRSGTSVGFGAIDLSSSAAVSGVLAVANYATGTPTGSKFVRDDGVLAVPSGSGGGTPLESHTASASASLAFTSSISGSYDNYVLELSDIIVATNNVQLLIEYSTDGGSTWTTSSDYYSAANLVQNNGGVVQFFNNPTTAFVFADAVSNSSTRPLNATLRLRSMNSTALHKTIYGEVAYTNQGFVVFGTWFGLLTVTSAFNAFRVRASSGNLTSGVGRCYGVPQ